MDGRLFAAHWDGCAEIDEVARRVLEQTVDFEVCQEGTHQ
jgi:hypothetical protein